MRGLFQLFWGKGGNFQGLGHRPLLGLLTVHGTVVAPLGPSFYLLIEDQGLVLSAILVPFGSNWLMLCPSVQFIRSVVSDSL